MLPDLASMSGLRIQSVAHTTAEAGRRFHYATDAIFHRAEHFQSVCSAATRALSLAGLRRGPARAVGHVGVELLLDGWLAGEHGVPALYAEALGLTPALSPAIVFRSEADAAPLLELCERIAAAPLAPDAWCEPERLAARLVRILARRPLLALEASELPAVRAWAASARGEIALVAPALFAEVRRGLA